MPNFDPNKLTVEYRDDVTPFGPIIPRYYTLTHSDATGDLHLTIGTQFAWDQLTPMRDEVLGGWQYVGGNIYFFVYLYIDGGQYTLQEATKRYEIFRRELPLALTAIRYGDRLLFDIHPNLNHAPIIVHFISAHPELIAQENWGTLLDYYHSL